MPKIPQFSDANRFLCRVYVRFSDANSCGMTHLCDLGRKIYLFEKKKKNIIYREALFVINNNKKKIFLKKRTILRHKSHNRALTGVVASLFASFCYTKLTFASQT